jgi:formylmethanofuran dehydrogenase subunit B
MVTTPYVARQHADVLLFIGDDVTLIWPQLIERLELAKAPALDLAPEPRRIVWIAPPKSVAIAGATIEPLETSSIKDALAALRARLAGRPIAAPAEAVQRLDALAAILNGARFGVAVWGPKKLDRLAVEMAGGLLIDLNKTTRFSSLPLGAADDAAGVVQTSGWSTGFPVRTSFGRGFPEHDTWRFDAARLVDSGEADAALWISAYSDAAPAWTRRVPLVALVPAGARFAAEPEVRIEIGRPGVDHDGADYSREVGAIVAREASHRSERPSAAAVIASIAQQISGDA